MKSNYSIAKTFLLSLFLLVFGSKSFGQVVCNPQANVVLYSNYDGGQLDINVDVNIPNLKIGVVSYEPVTINLSGPFVSNVTAVQFAGYVTTTNNHCINTPPQTNINGAPAGTDTIIFMPSSPLNNPNGYYIIICNYSCDTSTNQGGCNTPDQIAKYFLTEFGGDLRFHFTQYGCWTGVKNISDGGNCCIGAGPPSLLPVSNLQSSDTSFCEKQCIDFTDLSTNNPTSWQWTFTGAVPSGSTLQNPTNVCYNNYGSFDVSLIACNGAGCDTVTFFNFINEYPNPYDSIWNNNDTLYSLQAYSYQWYSVSSGLIAGANDSVYVPTMAGDYYCVITDSTGCIGTSNTVSVIGTSIADNIKNGLRLFPNPNSGSFNIVSDNLNLNLVALNLTDYTGKVVYQAKSLEGKMNRIELPGISKGIYVCRIITDKETVEWKVIVN